ncbi:protein disaggregation chaperone [Salmonella enterica subsp. enterica serovar Enteritidis str. 22558]|nr:protein disaggregation chaperone [Salmonella enterica subsp. enterica serovar Enteritidis str. 22558]
MEGTGGDVQPSSELVRVLNLCDKLAQNGETILFRQSCLFWRRLSLAAR